jgi:hypothetical protein
VIFKYGNYAHDNCECGLRVAATAIMDGYRRRMGTIFEYTIVGVKIVPTQATPDQTKALLTTALQSLEAAYAVDNQNCGLYLPDGVTATAHVLTSANTFGGVKVIQPPTYIEGPWTGQIEYLNRRSYSIVLRAEVRTGTGVHSYRERLTIKGNGGPRWRYSPQEVGDPQKQTLQTATTFFYIQEGQAIGRQAYPTPPAPLFPTLEHGPLRELAYDSPQDLNAAGNPEMYPISWKYVQEATVSQLFPGFLPP